MFRKFNERMVVVIIGVLAYSISLSAVSSTDAQAQGLSNQITNASGVGGEIGAEAQGLSNQTIIAPAAEGVMDAEGERGYVKIVTTCKLNNMSCTGMADDLFRITPSTFQFNRLNEMTPFPPSERGRTVEFFTDAGPVTYQIKQNLAHPAADLFHVYPHHSYDCEGEIQPGQTKQCNINTTLYIRR